MIVLDTHVWIWWIEGPGRLSESARSAIHAESMLGICAISCWEVAMLVRKKKLKLRIPAEQWIHGSLNAVGVSLLPLTPQAAVHAESGSFDSEADPADRMIAATAAEHGVPLVTHDRRLTELAHVQTIW